MGRLSLTRGDLAVSRESIKASGPHTLGWKLASKCVRPFSLRLRSLRRAVVLRRIPRVRAIRAVYSPSGRSAHALASVHRGRAVLQWPNCIDLHQVIALVCAA